MVYVGLNLINHVSAGGERATCGVLVPPRVSSSSALKSQRNCPCHVSPVALSVNTINIILCKAASEQCVLKAAYKNTM